MATSFTRAIAPIFAPYRENMLWRFDLTDYDAVKSNAGLIYSHISPAGAGDMPPPPLPPLAPSAVTTFTTWIAEACPP